MARILKGGPVAAAINERTIAAVEQLKKKGVSPTLAILRVGEKEDDLSYERGVIKNCSKVGIDVRVTALSADVASEDFFAALEGLNRDDTVHGILMFRPLPKHIDPNAARNAIDPRKDVDGCGDASLAGVFTDTAVGFAPCTAWAAMEIIDYYGVECSGRSAAVIGRSLVVGRPLAMLLMHRNATVTILHTRSTDVPAVTRGADIVVASAGRPEMLGAEYFAPGQTVIDVGISWNEEKGKLCGDVLFEEAEPIVGAITPVPGGVGTVTTAVLLNHVATAAQNMAK